MNIPISFVPIARISTDFPDKFGIPRQSNLVSSLRGRIIFEPSFRNIDALRGIEEFSHLWIIWHFSLSDSKWSFTVRPPILGGNVKKGVFATRSPFRPNPIGLSVVKLESVEYSGSDGPILHVSGIDMADQTPILDIKPYLPYVDVCKTARSGFIENVNRELLMVHFSGELLSKIEIEKQEALLNVLALDPRPAYHNDEAKIYGMQFAGCDIRFMVRNRDLYVVEVLSIDPV